jgi:hypothetical protein
MQSVGSTDDLISICVFPGRTYLKNWFTWENVPEQALLFTSKGILHVQAPALPNHDTSIVSIGAADLLYVRLSLILMYGCLELVDENLSRVVVEFNAAGFDIFQRGLQDILGTSCGRNTISIPDVPLMETVLSELGGLSFKFKNGLFLYGLLPEEYVLGYVFQHGIWGQHWHLFPLQMSETTLLALTDKQLIVVEEQSWSRFPAYGWILSFYPRKTIENIGVTSSRSWQELIIEMKSRAGLIERRILMEQANVLAWQELWSRFGNPHKVP